MGNKVKSYNSIDLVKLIMSFFVVGIHTVPLVNIDNAIINTLWECVVRTAVPFFFIASGFLIAQKADRSPESNMRAIVHKHLVKIIKLYLFWSAIYLPLAIYFFVKNNFSPSASVVHYFRGLLLIGENYNSWMLWYLLSTIYALVLVSILLKLHFNRTLITIIGGCFFLLGVFLDELVVYGGEMPAILWQVRALVLNTILNGRIFTGFFYIPVGMLLSEKKIPLGVGAAMSLGGFVGNFLFDGLVGSVMLAVCSLGIFVVVSKIELPDSPAYSVMRQASTTIYFVHMYMWTAYYSLAYGQVKYGFDCFIVTSIGALLIAFVQIYIKRKRSKPKECV